VNVVELTTVDPVVTDVELDESETVELVAE